MSNDPGGYGGHGSYGSFGNFGPTHLPPGYPPPGYPPPGYQAYPGYAPPPGYPGYPPPGYPGALKPGIIPLRPLTLSDIFNGAVAYIRANPKATLGLTTIVVIVSEIIALILEVVPLAATGRLDPALRGETASTAELIGLSVSRIAGSFTTALSAILLSGLLTVVVGRAVFGANITIGEAWQRLQGRLWALIGFTVLEGAGAAVLIGGVVLGIAVVAHVAGGAAAFVVGIPLGLAVIAALIYLGTILSFAPPLIVLERLGVIPAIGRSFTLVRNGFWRVFGIRLLAAVVTTVVAAAVAVPFTVVSQAFLASGNTAALALVIAAFGTAIGQIITAPFNAGVVVLLYTDRRIRAEAFDLVLQTGALQGYGAYSTDHLWLTRHF